MSESTLSGGFDLGAAPNLKDADEAGYTFQLCDPEGEPMWYTDAAGNRKPVTWTVCGEFSKTFGQIERRQMRRAAKIARNGGEIDVATTAAQNLLELAAGCTKGWDGIFNGGQPFPCTAENATALLSSDKAPHIRKQVVGAIRSHGNPTASPSDD